MTTYRYRMHQEDLAKQFSRWYHLSHNGDDGRGGRKTVCLLGIRADESLQRYSGILNKKYGYKGECWISKQFKDVWCASPLYDWSVGTSGTRIIFSDTIITGCMTFTIWPG